MHTNNNNTNSTAEGLPSHASEIPADKVLAHPDEHPAHLAAVAPAPVHTQGAVS